MNWYSEFEAILEPEVPLAKWTTFRIGGRAAFLLAPTDVASFARAYRAACALGLPVHVLGMGSNLLVSDAGVRGVVLTTMRLRERKTMRDDGVVRVGAGASLAGLLRWTARAGLSGLEFLAGVPGTVGGAVVMNAGGRGGGIGSRVHAIWAVERNGSLYRRGARDIAWWYRDTDIADPVVSVEFQLEEDDPETVQDRVAKALMEKSRSQPMGIPSAGCFFKNPPGDSAGRLIDAAGLKGLRMGHAAVSVKHANFIVNRGNATASDVWALCETVRERVRARFGVVLEREVRFWPSAVGLG